MSEKRDITRFRKRLSLRFGPDAPNRLAFTEDISVHGLFIKTTNICQPGTKVVVELILPDESSISLLAIVRWAKKVPPQMIHLVKKSGMGVKIVKFLSGKEKYDHLIAEMHNIRSTTTKVMGD